uniref:Putative mudr-1x sp n=1 Tax=Xenopsylla cheopis TaxID=163159 RepID=A0A6M2DPT9_XENCH
MDHKENKTFQCSLCQNYFANQGTLTGHMRKIHNKAPDYKSNDAFVCPHCDGMYRHKQSLQRHIALVHKKGLQASEDSSSGSSASFSGAPSVRGSRICCPFENCEEQFPLYKCLNTHLLTAHNITVQYQQLRFETPYDFYTWKEDMEDDTTASFVKTRGLCQTSDYKKIYYHCNRSFSFVSQSKNIRALKSLGSNKMGKACPARMIAAFYQTGVVVDFWESHVGHTKDVGRMRLSNTFKNSIAAKLKDGVTVDRILDDIRDSMISKIDRTVITSKQDLRNIEKQFHIHDTVMRNSDDMTSVALWVHEMITLDNSPILYYKGINTNVMGFNDEDFVLVIMTQYQFMLLQEFSGDRICIDGTHNTNNRKILLYTLLVVDEYGSGAPVSFCLSNRQDETVFRVFFQAIRTKAGGSLAAKVFMSDGENAFYNAWSSVMGHPEHRLLCSWHVDRNWRTNIVKVKDIAKRALVYQNLRELLHLTDVEIFNSRLEDFMKEIFYDEDTKIFSEYFKNQFLGKIKLWAYCYRLRLGVNTNMYLESFHKIFKYFYLNGKCSKRLDKTIHALMKYTRDACLNRLTRILKNTPTSKIRIIRKSHNISLKIDSSNIITLVEGVKWNITSQSDVSKVHEVERINKTCMMPCLSCMECNICIHTFICSCIENSIRMSICKHIHACAMKCQVWNDTDKLEVMDRNVNIEELLTVSSMDTACRVGRNNRTKFRSIR